MLQDMHPEPKGCSDGCERKPNYFGNHNDDENICIEDEGSKPGMYMYISGVRLNSNIQK